MSHNSISTEIDVAGIGIYGNNGVSRPNVSATVAHGLYYCQPCSEIFPHGMFAFQTVIVLTGGSIDKKLATSWSRLLFPALFSSTCRRP